MAKIVFPKLIDFVCAACKGKNVKRDAWAQWDPRNQFWEVKSIHDQAYCDDCDEETNLEEIPYSSAEIPDILKRCVMMLDEEIENRQHGGNAEDWADLKALSDDCINALIDIGEIDHGSNPETA
jgi:hypothetical protein